MDDHDFAEAWTAVSKKKQREPGASGKLTRQLSHEEQFTAATVARLRAEKAAAVRQGQKAKEEKSKVDARVEARAIAHGGLLAYQSAHPVADRGAHVRVGAPTHEVAATVHSVQTTPSAEPGPCAASGDEGCATPAMALDEASAYNQLCGSFVAAQVRVMQGVGRSP
jgi:hypothetical protein